VEKQVRYQEPSVGQIDITDLEAKDSRGAQTGI
jgi:hypothetical protein